MKTMSDLYDSYMQRVRRFWFQRPKE